MWLFILIIVVVVVFLFYRQARLLLIELNLAKARRDSLFKENWTIIVFYVPNTPLRMTIQEVVNKSVYRKNFDVHFNRFMRYALIADERLDSRIVELYSSQLADNLLIISDMSLDADADQVVGRDFTNEIGMVLSAALYAFIVTQDKGANIRDKLMLGNKYIGNDMYLQQKDDKDYFEYMNKNYPSFCRLLSIIEPRKAVQMEIVAGYLLTE